MIKKVSTALDLVVTIPIILLISLGIMIIYSSDSRLAFQQLIFALLGLGLYFFLSSFDLTSLKNYSRQLYVLILVLLVIVFLLGIETRGSLRWIPLGGIQIQPSEFTKPILILILAWFWSNRYPDWKNILLSFLLVLPLIGLIFRQPDLGTALTLLAIWTTALLATSVSNLRLLIMGVVVLIAAPFSWHLLKDYQKERFLSFLSPNQDPLGMGYNVIQSIIAVGSGQLIGQGLGHGTQSRLQFLPEYRTDFIFASLAEELGFIGACVVLILYGFLVFRILRIVSSSRSQFGNVVCFGVLGMLFFQIVVNIGMNLGLMPITGITLPLLSYGGSSLIATLISLSFVVSISRFCRKTGLEEEQ